MGSGNAVGPVALIAIGIGLGYLVITNRVSKLQNLFSGAST